MPNFTEVIESLCANDMAPGLTAEEVAAQMPKIISNSDWWKVDLEKFHPVEELQLLINEFISHINHIKKGDPTRFVAFTLLDVLAFIKYPSGEVTAESINERVWENIRRFNNKDESPGKELAELREVVEVKRAAELKEKEEIVQRLKGLQLHDAFIQVIQTQPKIPYSRFDKAIKEYKTPTKNSEQYNQALAATVQCICKLYPSFDARAQGNLNEALVCLLHHPFLPSRILTLYHAGIVGNDNYFEILNQIEKMTDEQFQLLKTKLFVPDRLTQFDRIHNLTAFNAAIRNEDKLLEEKKQEVDSEIDTSFQEISDHSQSPINSKEVNLLTDLFARVSFKNQGITAIYTDEAIFCDSSGEKLQLYNISPKRTVISIGSGWIHAIDTCASYHLGAKERDHWLLVTGVTRCLPVVIYNSQSKKHWIYHLHPASLSDASIHPLGYLRGFTPFIALKEDERSNNVLLKEEDYPLQIAIIGCDIKHRNFSSIDKKLGELGISHTGIQYIKKNIPGIIEYTVGYQPSTQRYAIYHPGERKFLVPPTLISQGKRIEKEEESNTRNSRSALSLFSTTVKEEKDDDLIRRQGFGFD
ncbi:hypothetical protein [Coxiella burnetii]|uniref:hypothetical protein n=1 Tax=Coxiella burnetii TaxID=777 RepID=UPI001E296164|nr:hypothetical protein [Coxiella burnetii]